MEALECIKTRRSIRKFKPDLISQEIIDDLLDCAVKAPSGCNKQPWSFVIVKDEEKRKLLSQVQPWASFVAKAPVCIIACMQRESKDQPSGYMSIACSVENLMLAAHSYGLGVCWTYVKDFVDTSVEDKVKEILHIPEDIEVICMIPLGYPDEIITGRNLKKKEDIIHEEKW